MPSFLPCGKAGGLQIRRCQGFAVDLLRRHPWRLGSEALRLLQHWGLESWPLMVFVPGYGSPSVNSSSTPFAISNSQMRLPCVALCFALILKGTMVNLKLFLTADANMATHSIVHWEMLCRGMQNKE